MAVKNPSQQDVDRLAESIRTFIRVLLVSGRSGKPAKGLIPFNPLYFHFLGYLLEQGSSRPSQIAEFLGVPRSTLSTASRALQNRGLLKSERDLEDGRAQRVSLTKIGEDVAQAIREQDEENMRIMLSFIEPKDQKKTLEIFETIAAKLNQL